MFLFLLRLFFFFYIFVVVSIENKFLWIAIEVYVFYFASFSIHLPNVCVKQEGDKNKRGKTSANICIQFNLNQCDHWLRIFLRKNSLVLVFLYTFHTFLYPMPIYICIIKYLNFAWQKINRKWAHTLSKRKRNELNVGKCIQKTYTEKMYQSFSSWFRKFNVHFCFSLSIVKMFVSALFYIRFYSFIIILMVLKFNWQLFFLVEMFGGRSLSNDSSLNIYQA